MENVRPYSLFTEHDIYLFREGKHYRLYEKFGAHTADIDGVEGTYFAVWAPHAREVSVLGNFNRWHSEKHKLYPRWDGSGIWEGFIAGLNWGTIYKYGIRTNKGALMEKSDPFALSWEQNIQAASQISTTYYDWNDEEWMKSRKDKNSVSASISVYEVHLGSLMRDLDNPKRFLSYREIAERLIPYVKEMGFTHVEFMPVMEHPYEPSWGYQITGFFAANSRFGAPQDLMHLIDELHRHDIGVFLDWVPSHFPGDANGLHFFDGTYLYEHEDPRKGYHPQWNSHIFNYGRPEVKSFLISNALFWLDRYHADGLRVDAVTSILYLDYAREEGQWIPNMFGGNINLEAKEFLQEFNRAVHEFYPEVLTIAEESSDFPKLTKSLDEGGIGFDMKWMMGWMHDTLKYFSEDPLARKYHHNKVTFTSMYMHNEKYMMPLSHDEVVHGKASMIYKMPGDEWQKFANLRALYTYLFTHPGAKLLFMGSEFAQTNDWRFAESLSWNLLQHQVHHGMREFVKDLNHLYTSESSMFENQFLPDAFEWVEANDNDNSIFVYLRKGAAENDRTMTILNLTPRVLDYKIGIDAGTNWEVILNSDDEKYGGSGVRAEILDEEDDEWMMRANAITMKLPPLAGIVLKQKTGKKMRKTTKKTTVTTPKKTDAAKPKAVRKSTVQKKNDPTLISANVVTEQHPETKINAEAIEEAKSKRPVVSRKTAVKSPAKTAVKKPRVNSPEVKETIVSASVVTGIHPEDKISADAVAENTVEETRGKTGAVSTKTPTKSLGMKSTKTRKATTESVKQDNTKSIAAVQVDRDLVSQSSTTVEKTPSKPSLRKSAVAADSKSKITEEKPKDDAQSKTSPTKGSSKRTVAGKQPAAGPKTAAPKAKPSESEAAEVKPARGRKKS